MRIAGVFNNDRDSHSASGNTNYFGERTNDVLFRWKRGTDIFGGFREPLVERGNNAINYGIRIRELFRNGYFRRLYINCLKQRTDCGQSDSGHANDYGQRLDNFL